MSKTAKALRQTFQLLAGAVIFLASVNCQAQPLEWTAQQPLSDYGAIDGQNEMASWSVSDGQGTIVTVYKSAGGLAGSRSLDGGQTWSHVFGSSLQAPVGVFDADVVYAGSGTFVATWIGGSTEESQIKNSLIYVRKSVDNGQTWSAPVAIPSDPVTSIPFNFNTMPDIDAASDGNGGIIATARTRLYKSTDFGDSWTSSGLFAQFSPYFQPPHGSRIAYNGEGKWVHVYSYWQNYGIGGLDGYYETWYAGVSTDGENWTKVRLQSTYDSFNVLYSNDVAATGDSIGIFGTINSSFGVIKSLDGGATFSSPTPVHVGNLSTLSVGVSGNRWFAMGQRPGVKILDGYISEDGMNSWTSVNHPASGAEEAHPSVAVDGSNFIVSYGQLQKSTPQQLGPDWDIKADRFTTSWSTGGFVNTNAATDIPYIDDANAKMDSSPDGTVVAVWTISGYSEDSDICFARSEDGGVTWSNSAPIDNHYASEVWNDADARVVYIGGTNWLAYWTGREFGTYYVRSSDHGHTWTDPAQLHTEPLLGVRVASNQNGTLMLSGFPFFEPNVILRSTNGGDTWSTVHTGGDFRNIVHTGGSAWLAAGHGTVTISEDDGQNWETVFTVPAVNVGAMELATDHNGTVMAATAIAHALLTPQQFVVWSATTTDNGRTWTLAEIYKRPLSESTGSGISMSAAGNGEWAAAWSMRIKAPGEKDYRNEKIYAATSADNGVSWNFTERVSLSSVDDRELSPATVASVGKVVTVWNNVPGNTDSPFGLDSDVFYATADLGDAPPPPTIPILSSKAAIKLNFAKTDKDSIKLTGNLEIPVDFNPLGMTVAVNVGGIERIFVMDAKGKANVGSDKFRLKFKSKNGVVEAQVAKLQLKLKKGNFAADLADEGLINGDSQNTVNVNVTIYLGDNTAAADLQLFYKAKAGKKGTAK